ncbi:MAG: 7-cyano-7-deazaguanine synthase QueC [Planctomycetota bacterium]
MSDAPIAVVLLSGGLDSATCLAIARADGCAAHCLTVSYGQRHAIELDAAARVASHLGAASHRTLSLDLRAFGGSSLTDDTIAVPKSDDAYQPDDDDIPSTYVPARNTMLLACALGYAEVLAASRIYAGMNAVDYSGYPDCRPEFVSAFQYVADVGTKAGVEGRGVQLLAPLIELTKVEIIRRGLELGVDYALTHSCYDPDENGQPCGRCDSCRIRDAAFGALGMTDPALG